MDKELVNKALDMEIEKTFAAIGETNRIAGTAFASYFLFLISAAALIAGEGLGLPERATIPLVQLTVSRQLAGGAALFISSGALYRWLLASTMEGILARELRGALRRRFGTAIKGRFLYRHTSLIRMTTIVFDSLPRVSRAITGLLLLGIYAATLILPTLLAWLLARTAALAQPWHLALILASTLAIVPSWAVLAANDRALPDDTEPVVPTGWRKVITMTAFAAYLAWWWLLVAPWDESWWHAVPWLTMGTLAAMALAIFTNPQMIETPEGK